MSSTSRADASHAVRTAAKPPAISALDAHLGYWLRMVSNHASHAFKTKVEQEGVTVAEWVVLRALFDDDAVMPSVLAARLGLTRGTISKLVDRLVAKELVSIRRDTHDGRAQIVMLRASGRRLVPKLAALADENDAESFGHLDHGERAALLSILKRVVEHAGIGGAVIE